MLGCLQCNCVLFEYVWSVCEDDFLTCLLFYFSRAGRGSSIRCVSAWYADGRRLDPQVRQHSFVEFGHEIISTAILSLPLIQEGQLSATGERMCIKYW